MKPNLLIAIAMSFNAACTTADDLNDNSGTLTSGDPRGPAAVMPVNSPASMAQCPVMGGGNPAGARHTAAGAMSNSHWWPNQLNLKILHQNSQKGNPLGAGFDYAKAFQ